MELRAILVIFASDDPRALLAAMLQRIETVVGEPRRVGMIEHPEHAARVLESVFVMVHKQVGKPESRNPKQIRMTKIQNGKFYSTSLSHSNFEFVSDFVLRHSSFFLL